MIPGMGRSPGEGEGYQLQYSGLENSTDIQSTGSQIVGHNGKTFTFTSTLKHNFISMCIMSAIVTCGFAGDSGKTSLVKQKLSVQSLGQEDPLERKITTFSSALVWEIP